MPNAPRIGAPHLPISAHEDLARRGALALALINTETLDRGKQRDGLPSPEALAQWWEETCKRYPDQCAVVRAEAPIAWTNDLLAAIKALRMALHALATRVVEQKRIEEEDLRPVNEALALGYPALERTGQGALTAVLRLRDAEQGCVLTPIARSALRLFTEADWRRLHQCKHDRCIVFFYDTTKSGTRRWCSPGCMNRARSIQHYRLAKKAAALEP
jgi:predicted RNA-binding Zn ribbon-like protein